MDKKWYRQVVRDAKKNARASARDLVFCENQIKFWQGQLPFYEEEAKKRAA
jgi:hypothetical protein